MGSRDVDESDVAWAEELAAACAGDGITVISGGARGTDQIAMVGALSAGGNAIGVLAEGLGKPSVVARYREAILGDRLVLVPASAEEVSVARDTSSEVRAIPAVDRSAPSYEAALPRIVAALDVPCTAKRIAERTGMESRQLRQWLKRAVEEKAIVKMAKPERYALPQRGLFDSGKQE